MQVVGCVLLVFFVLFHGPFAEGNVLTLDDSSEIFATTGGSHTLNATVTTSDFSNHSLVEIYHRNVVTSAERLLVSMVDYNSTSATTTAGYSIVVTEVNDTIKTLSFGIQSLSFQDDGTIDFHVKSTNGNANYSADRNITVVVGPESVKLRFGSRSDLTSNSSQSVSVGSGNYTVYCLVEESNPAISDITVTLNGDDVAPATGPDPYLASATERKYSSNVSVLVEVPNSINVTQTLICTAQDHFGNLHAIQFLYQLSTAGEGLRPILGLISLLAIFPLWHTL